MSLSVLTKHSLGDRYLYGISLGVFLMLNPGTSQAQTLPPEELSAPPKVLELLQAKLRTPQVTQNQPSEASLTVPGLWWADQLFGEKMVTRWSVHQNPQAIDSQVRAIVRPDLWSRYTYLERFAFLRRFGTTTSAAGYHLLVLDRRDYPLGAYICEFAAGTRPVVLYPWLRPTLSGHNRTQQPTCNAWISPVYNGSFL
jgi:hypothetical protein